MSFTSHGWQRRRRRAEPHLMIDSLDKKIMVGKLASCTKLTKLYHSMCIRHHKTVFLTISRGKTNTTPRAHTHRSSSSPINSRAMRYFVFVPVCCLPQRIACHNKFPQVIIFVAFANSYTYFQKQNEKRKNNRRRRRRRRI